MSKLRDAIFERSLLGLGLRRVFRDLCRSDRSLWDEVTGGADRTLSEHLVVDLGKRDASYFQWARSHLEEVNKSAEERHEHIVRKTLALVGWFSVVFAGLSIPNRVFQSPSALATPWMPIAAVLWCIALVMFIWSLFAACRVLWRVVLLEDTPAWLAADQFDTEIALCKERVLELMERIPQNTDSIAVKTILYQGAVWSFFVSALFAVASLLVSGVGALAGTQNVNGNQSGPSAAAGITGTSPSAQAGVSMGIELSHLWTVAGVLIGLQLAAFARRIEREVTVGDRADVTWLPPADLLNLTAMLVALVGVFVLPIAGLAPPNLPAAALGLSILLFAGYPFALAGHYDLFTRTRRRPRYVTPQETIVIVITVILCAAYLVWSPLVVTGGAAVLSPQSGELHSPMTWADSTLAKFFRFDTAIDVPGILIGFVLGVVSPYVVDRLWRPRVRAVAFVRDAGFNLGPLYKLRFTLRGRSVPGFCCLRIEWSGGSVFAKWDEAPNPLAGDDPNRFRPELVPATFFQPLFLRRQYTVPILIEREGRVEVFSGWWFGRPVGYGPDPAVARGETIRLTLLGGGFEWSRDFTVDQVLRAS